MNLFRRSLSKVKSFFLFSSLLLSCVGGVSGMVFTTNMNATTVVGQLNFTDQITAVTQTTAPNAVGCAVSATGKFAVAEGFTGRVLIWNSIPTTNGQPADVVVGKPDFVSSNLPGVTQSWVVNAGGVAFSPNGQKLIVSDYLNNRVLIWNTIPTTNGALADVVIGQTNFTSNAGGTTASILKNPDGIAVTPGGRLIISDWNNNRVLIWNTIPTTNGVAADVVVGQTLKTNGGAGIGPNQMWRPWGLAVASDGRLLVAEEGNHRVLIFPNVPTSDNAFASYVIGQPGFVWTGAATTQTGLNAAATALGVSVSNTGQVAISDSGNHRVLIYHSIPNSNGAPANVVLGQPDFTSGTFFNGGVSAHSMRTPYSSVFAPDGRLIVPGRDMHRVMIYGTAATIPTVNSVSESSITSASAVLDGNFPSNGGSAITQQGFVWSTTNTTPTLSDTIVAGTTYLGPINSPQGFLGTATGLPPGTVIYWRAYATNGVGTGYGLPRSFATPAAVPTVFADPVISVYNAASNCATLIASLEANGGAAVTEFGFVWSTSANPTITSPNKVVASGSFWDLFFTTINGLPPGTLIHFRAYATNSAGTGYSGDVAFTTLPVRLVPEIVVEQPPGTALSAGVIAWGSNPDGEATVLPAYATSGVTAMATGESQTLVITSNGNVDGWGSNASGQLTFPPETQTGSIIAVASGGVHSLALRSDGRVFAWGYNAEGQTNVPLLAQCDVVAIAAGSNHSMALRSDGTVITWGLDAHSQVTIPTLAQTGVKAISANYHHSWAIKTSGSIIGWGQDLNGETVPYGPAAPAALVAPGYIHTTALTAAGGGVTWGFTGDSRTTVPAAAQSGIVGISAGREHALALKRDGTVIGWGLNSYGQITVPPPAQTCVSAVSSTRYHSAVLKYSPIAFSSQATGTMSPTKSFTIRNTGTGSLSLSSVALVGPNPGDFAITPAVPASLSAGSSCDVHPRRRRPAAGHTQHSE